MNIKTFQKTIRNNKRGTKTFIYLFLIVLLYLIFHSSAPSQFPRGEMFLIKENSTVSETAEQLVDIHAIRSAFLYKLYVVLLHDGRGVQAGRYLFVKPQSALRLAYRTAFGIKDLEKIKITIPEGKSSREIAAILAKNIERFDGAEFHNLAIKKEGYLFPDTYFFDQGTDPFEALRTMTTVFNEKISTIKKDLDDSGKSLEDIITMASILEEEENNPEDRRIISGILWKRIEAGMPLQVDAPFYYLYGKGSSQLSKDDLAASSPYNTYKNKGLPAGPISNPGIDAILAAVEPIETKYWFYLSDKTGQTHYAIDHDGHVANKDRYLR